MTAKEYLSQAFYLDKRINSKQKQLERLKARTMRATSVLSDMPRSHSGETSPMEKTLVKALDLETEISQDMDDLLNLLNEIKATIESINRIEYITLLEMRYLEFLKWEDIAATLGYTEDYTFQLHRRALALIHVPS